MLKLITAFIGTIGIAMLSNIRGKKLLFAGLGGLLSWLMVMAAEQTPLIEVIRTFFVSVAATAYAETMARIFKCPATVFLVSAVFPLLPGGKLYYTMIYAINGEMLSFLNMGFQALYTSIAIGLGIMAISSFFKVRKIFIKN